MIQTYTLATMPSALLRMQNPPHDLYVCSKDEHTFSNLLERKRVAVVGTRKITPYGQYVTRMLVNQLAARGIVIVSGLAYGVDSFAHRAALEVDGLTLAVLPSPVEDVQPSGHRNLARAIVERNGALVSEYPKGYTVQRQHFVARNRIVAGIADALLIIEAGEVSGTLHTAQFALEQGMDVLVIPGAINNPSSTGANNLIKSGAHPVTNINDILFVLGIETGAEPEFDAKSRTRSRKRTPPAPTPRIKGANSGEQLIIDLIEQGVQDGGDILRASGLAANVFGQHLTMLELAFKIRALGGNQWALS